MTQAEYEAIMERSLDNFSDKTYENLMRETLDRVSQAFDKRDGSMIYNAIAALCFEIAMMYGALDFVFDATYIDTAPREYLIKRAADRSITPRPATGAIYFANIDRADPVPKGTRFSCEDQNFVVIPYPEEETEVLRKEITLAGEEPQTRMRQLVQCETPGTIGNSYGGGDLIPIEYIDGLEKATLCESELYSVGVDEEGTEEFRARVKEAMRSIAFGGNIADYTQKVLEIDGVGQVKVHPIWNNAGTVKLVIIGNDPANPTISDELLDDVQEIVDPIGGERGKGYGLAPIGHIVTIVKADETPVDITFEVTKKIGVTDGEVKTAITPVLESYLASVVKKWSASGEGGVTILPSIISYKILDDETCASLIESVESIAINESEPWANVTLTTDQVPVIGEVTVE
jgi:uncharacterized phage protein gp47/JayE